MESWRQQYIGLESVLPSLTDAEIDFFFAPSKQALPRSAPSSHPANGDAPSSQPSPRSDEHAV
jgi:hypothetical protein